MATAQEILHSLTSSGDLGRTNINNIKYNKDNNDTTFVSGENKIAADKTTSFSGIASRRPLGEAMASSGSLPSNWRGVKLDLFENPDLVLKITIVRKDGSKFPCVSHMNSPKRHVFRGRQDGQGTDYHWRLVEYLLEIRDDFDYRISKVTKPKKAGTITDFVAGIYLHEGLWHCDLVFEHQIWQLRLDKPLTERFQKSNGIATGYQGITGYQRPWATAEELGI